MNFSKREEHLSNTFCLCSFLQDWTISSPVLGVGRCGLTVVSLVSEPSLDFPKAWLLIGISEFYSRLSVPAIHPIFNHASLHSGSDLPNPCPNKGTMGFLHAYSIIRFSTWGWE